MTLLLTRGFEFGDLTAEGASNGASISTVVDSVGCTLNFSSDFPRPPPPCRTTSSCWVKPSNHHMAMHPGWRPRCHLPTVFNAAGAESVTADDHELPCIPAEYL